MKYQLEIELPTTSLDDLDTLIEIESAVVDSLGSQHYVDGHDFGSGIMTIFILIDFPDEAFEASIDLCNQRNSCLQVKQGIVIGQKKIILSFGRKQIICQESQPR